MLQRALTGTAGERSFRSKHRCVLLLVDVDGGEPDHRVGKLGELPRVRSRRQDEGYRCGVGEGSLHRLFDVPVAVAGEGGGAVVIVVLIPQRQLRIVPAAMRSTGFGIFETGFGIAWFLGSWLLGALYDANPTWLVAVSVSVQLLAIVFYGLCIKKQKKERSV